jgi:2-methylcitrate dehydratase PrpD
MAADDIERTRLLVLHALGMACANAVDTDGELKGLGPVFEGNVSGPMLPFPCRPEIHGYIEAVYMLREETGLHDAEVVNIVCHVTPQALAVLEGPGENVTPHDTHEAKNSIPYCVAAALVLNKINRTAFADEAIRNPRIQALMRKVSCAVDPGTSEDESRVTVNRVHGRPVECVVTVSLGSPNNEMTAEQVYAVFRDDMAYAGRSDIAEAAIAIIEKMNAPSDAHALRDLFIKR